jgi:hypothetical protein
LIKLHLDLNSHAPGEIHPTSAMGQQRRFRNVRDESAYPPIAALKADMPARRIRADFVAEVRCKLFWSVIPSL